MQRLQTRTVVLIISSLYIIQCISVMSNSVALTPEPGPPRRHCVVSLNKTLCPLLRTGSTQEDPSGHH